VGSGILGIRLDGRPELRQGLVQSPLLDQLGAEVVSLDRLVGGRQSGRPTSRRLIVRRRGFCASSSWPRTPPASTGCGACCPAVAPGYSGAAGWSCPGDVADTDTPWSLMMNIGLDGIPGRSSGRARCWRWRSTQGRCRWPSRWRETAHHLNCVQLRSPAAAAADSRRGGVKDVKYTILLKMSGPPAPSRCSPAARTSPSSR